MDCETISASSYIRRVIMNNTEGNTDIVYVDITRSHQKLFSIHSNGWKGRAVFTNENDVTVNKTISKSITNDEDVINKAIFKTGKQKKIALIVNKNQVEIYQEHSTMQRTQDAIATLFNVIAHFKIF